MEVAITVRLSESDNLSILIPRILDALTINAGATDPVVETHEPSPIEPEEPPVDRVELIATCKILGAELATSGKAGVVTNFLQSCGVAAISHLTTEQLTEARIAWSREV